MVKRRNLAIGGILIAGASYLAGILTAPKSGKETRRDIQLAASKAKSKAERKLKHAYSELTDLLQTASKTVKQLGAKADKELKAALVRAEAVKQKTREILSAIHEGEAEDYDLDKALKDVKSAIKHIKNYSTKPKANKAH